MTSLMMCARRTGKRGWTAGTVAASFLVAIGGCAEDRAANSDSKRTPIAVTASGVEIMEVVKNEHERTVEAVVVAGGEERQVTILPFLDGPLPSGVAATLHSDDGRELVQLTYGWDDQSGANWIRQQIDDDVLELTRTVVDDRVFEKYTANGRSLVLEYADLPPKVANSVAGKFLRGEPTNSDDPEVVEFVDQLRRFDAFAAQIPHRLLVENMDGQILTSLLSDRAFAGTLEGKNAGGVVPNGLIEGVCSLLRTCMSVACRISPVSTLCGVCVAGSVACTIMEVFCSWGWCS